MQIPPLGAVAPVRSPFRTSGGSSPPAPAPPHGATLTDTTGEDAGVMVGTLLADTSLTSLAAMQRHRAYGSVARVVGHEVEIRGLAVRGGGGGPGSWPSRARVAEVVARR